MASLTRKENIIEKKLELDPDVKKIFQAVYNDKNKKTEIDDDVPKVKVSEVVSKLAFYYEKIRNAIDYNEEYLLRKNAISRILKRLIVIEGGSNTLEIAKSLLTELIRAGYLPNNKIPKTKIEEISVIVDKYLKLRNASLKEDETMSALKQGHVVQAKDEMKARSEANKWLMGLAASELDESFGRSKVHKIVVNNMYSILSDAVKLQEGLPYEKDLKIQVYLGIHRNFMKFDDEMLAFLLFRYFNPNWNIISDEEIKHIADHMQKLKEVIKYQLSHPLKKQVDKITIKYTVFYTILIDVITDEPIDVYNKVRANSPIFTTLIKKACTAKYDALRKTLWRAAVRSIVYIFLTKSVVAVLIEIPATKIFGQSVDVIALIVNISFPAILLFFIVTVTKMPGNADTEEIIDGIKTIAFKNYKEQGTHTLRKPEKRGKFINYFFGGIYLFTYIVSFGFIIFVLNKVGFNWVSITIFLFFLALVSFFSVRIRKSSREFVLVEEVEGIVAFFIDFLSVPVIVVGKWLSEKFAKFNFFVILFDFFLEAPFKILVKIADEWTRYAKERKDEIL